MCLRNMKFPFIFSIRERTPKHISCLALICRKDGVRGVVFRVWAPKAADVSVVGDFNHWNREESYMKKSATAVFGSFLSPDSRSLIITNTA